MGLRTVINTLHRSVYPFLPVFARALGVPLEVFSGAIALRSLAGALSPILSSVGERHGRRAGMLFGLALFGLGMLVILLWPVFPGFVAGIILAVMGKSVIDPSMHAFIGDSVPFARRGRAVAVVELGWSLSFLLGIPAMGYLIKWGGWLAPFPIFLILTVVAMAGVFYVFRRGAASSGDRPTLGGSARSILKSPLARAGLAMVFFLSVANELVNVVFGVWLEQSFELKLAALAGASFVIGGSELLGESLVGVLTDRLGKPRAVGLGILLNCLSAILLPIISTTSAGAFVGLFLFYVTFEFTVVSSIPMMTELTSGSRATFMGFVILVLSIGRAAGDLTGLSLYRWGIGAVVAANVALNLAAILMVRRVALGVSDPGDPRKGYSRRNRTGSSSL